MLCVPDPKEYHWTSQGVIVVDNMDDGEEMQLTDVSVRKGCLGLRFLDYGISLNLMLL